MRVLVTRPRADAGPLAEALQARGHTVQIEPLLDIIPLSGAAPSLDGVQGLLATSANGVRALTVNTKRRDLPVWAVGDSTASEARSAGFAQVETAGGDVAALAHLVAEKADPKRGAFLHVTGSHAAGDLAGRLGAQGFEIRRAILYEARPIAAFGPELRAALSSHAFDVALFFSPRTAATFVRLAAEAGLGNACSGAVAYALSIAVAKALEAMKWRAMRVAARPTQESILASIDADHRSR